MIDLNEAARQADADAESDRRDAETRRETPRTPWSVRLHDTTIEILDADGAPVQWTKRHPKTEATVALIVEAVNWYAAWGAEEEGEGGDSMTDPDTLLAQALALVNEDKRGPLADLIEAIVMQAQYDLSEVLSQTPHKVYVLATGSRLYDIQGVYATRAALETDARHRRIHTYDVGELMVMPEAKQP